LRSIAEAVAIRRKLAETNPDAFLPALATSLNNQSNRQSEMGQRAEALRSIAEAVAIRRKLAETNPDAFLPALAMSLNNQSNRQSEMGQRAEALCSIAEAVAIRRKLAETNPDAFLPDLAMSCGVWGQILIELAPAEAAEKFSEGIRIIAPFVNGLPQAFLPRGLQLAGAYVGACEAAGIEPDPEIASRIEVFLRLEREGG
jgi:tetratricopeptide (TPR) repeat protein